jgi:hypothetical protein
MYVGLNPLFLPSYGLIMSISSGYKNVNATHVLFDRYKKQINMGKITYISYFRNEHHVWYSF